VVCTGDSNAASQMLELTGGQYAYAAVDPVGSTTTQLAASVTRPEGQVIIYGALAGRTLTVNIFDILLKKQIVVSRFPAPARSHKTLFTLTTLNKSWIF
jgi:NADPH:quinone reductase-like Zn-dependent oxidoreductase